MNTAQFELLAKAALKKANLTDHGWRIEITGRASTGTFQIERYTSRTRPHPTIVCNKTWILTLKPDGAKEAVAEFVKQTVAEQAKRLGQTGFSYGYTNESNEITVTYNRERLFERNGPLFKYVDGESVRLHPVTETEADFYRKLAAFEDGQIPRYITTNDNMSLSVLCDYWEENGMVLAAQYVRHMLSLLSVIPPVQPQAPALTTIVCYNCQHSNEVDLRDVSTYRCISCGAVV